MESGAEWNPVFAGCSYDQETEEVSQSGRLPALWRARPHPWQGRQPAGVSSVRGQWPLCGELRDAPEHRAFQAIRQEMMVATESRHTLKEYYPDEEAQGKELCETSSGHQSDL